MFLWQGPGGQVLPQDGKILWGVLPKDGKILRLVLLNTSLILSSDLSLAGSKNHFPAYLEALRAGEAFQGMYHSGLPSPSRKCGSSSWNYTAMS